LLFSKTEAVLPICAQLLLVGLVLLLLVVLLLLMWLLLAAAAYAVRIANAVGRHIIRHRHRRRAAAPHTTRGGRGEKAVWRVGRFQ
jgi:hypothetical protein